MRIILSIVVALILFSPTLGLSAANLAPPNIVVILTDDQGYADLSAFKHHAEDVSTPNMDRLAARGVLFTDAYTSAPVCSPFAVPTKPSRPARAKCAVKQQTES